MEQSIEDILFVALEAVKRDSSIPAIEALQKASANCDGLTRKAALQCLIEASTKPEMGKGDEFQEAIVERAIRSLSNRGKKTAKQPAGKTSPQPSMKIDTEGKLDMSENNENNSNATETKASRAKKYTMGDTFNTVATLGLQATDAARKATCGFQFSRKTGKAGSMDLPEGTEIRYMGARSVYDGQSNSKRMIFKATKGTKVILNGAESTLDDDIEIAGVVNHIDADDPYNIQARENEAKREEKARLKAAAAATKTQAA